MVLSTYARNSGLCIDPIEKKPLFHFLPGSSILSFGTTGCNLACRFCQNWDLSKSRAANARLTSGAPEAIATAARQQGSASVAFTYNDPVIFAEYAMDTADACHELGIKTVAVTAGFMHLAPAKAFFAKIDGANIDLKSFSDDFYHRLCAGRLRPVLDLLAYVRHQTRCWLEITTLIIPGLNDSADEIRRLSDWCYRELGSDVPLHFSAFRPSYRLTKVPATTPQQLRKARQIALDSGLRHVYIGNVDDAQGSTTYCPSCATPLIERHRYTLLRTCLDESGRCPQCNTAIPGVF